MLSVDDKRKLKQEVLRQVEALKERMKGKPEKQSKSKKKA